MPECLPCNCKDCLHYPCDMPQYVIDKVEAGEKIFCCEFQDKTNYIEYPSPIQSSP